jgi:hypothetical protein
MFPKAKVLTLIAIILVFSVCQLQAAIINSRWVGGEEGEWGDASNWVPAIVPDNSDWRTFTVTIDSNSIGVSEVEIAFLETRNIDQLECYGAVSLDRWTSLGLELTVVNGVTNYGKLQFDDLDIKGDVTNTSGALLDLDGMDIDEGNLYNHVGGLVEVEGTVYIEEEPGGNVQNAGTLIVDPGSALVVDFWVYNSGNVKLLDGRCEAYAGFHNDMASLVEGFGLVVSEEIIANKGTIRATADSLVLYSSGRVTNIGTLVNKPLSTLHIKSAEDVNNIGTIEVNAGGGVAFDCNLVNEPNAVIKLLGGTLAAKTITQKAGATFQGFGGITSNVVIESYGVIKLTGPTNIVGDVNIAENAILEISDGTVLITSHTICNGTIRTKNGQIITQGGLSGNCNIISE